jgi:hypothetical protein
MHEYMKKALIAALLVLPAAFAPCLSSVVDFPDRTSELACAAASPLFWQFWDELLSRELAHWTKTVSEDDQESEWPLEFRSVPIYLLFQVFSNTRLKDPHPPFAAFVSIDNQEFQPVGLQVESLSEYRLLDTSISFVH